METFIRLMVLKHRYRWGFRTLVAEVSDSIHLRRFCRISLTERVPDESAVRKLTRRIGAETVAELTRALIVKATREKRFRPRAVRIDSTVIEADVRYPTDAGRKLRAITRTIRRRSGEAKSEVLKLTQETGELLQRSIKEARRVVAAASRTAPGRGAKAKLKAAASLEEWADRGERIATQIRQRVAGEPIKDRIVSLVRPRRPADPQGQAGQAGQAQLVCVRFAADGGDREHQRGARGLILPASTELGNPAEDTLLPGTVAELGRLGISVREVAVDGGFTTAATNTALENLQPKQTFIAGRQEPASKRTQRYLRRYRTGAEGRINHLKRRYGLDRSRLKGDEGRQIWTEWAILAALKRVVSVRATRWMAKRSSSRSQAGGRRGPSMVTVRCVYCPG
jgi:IS5 family transposase